MEIKGDDIMVKLCFDYGHGGKDPGAIYQGRRESVDNLAIGRELGRKVLLLGMEVGETRTGDIYRTLRERVDFANRGSYDYFISFHRNAFKPELASGAEVFIHPQASARARVLAEAIQEALVRSGFKNRGVKRADHYVLRGTKMPAVLIEIGFIDNSLDNYIFDHKRDEIVNRIARVLICRNL